MLSVALTPKKKIAASDIPALPPLRAGPATKPPVDSDRTMLLTRRPIGPPDGTSHPQSGDQPAPIIGCGSILKGRFVLESIVGYGGMGVVFKARDLRKEEANDRDPYVAIKILNDEFRHHPESLTVLQRESRKAQHLAHPNIVTVHDFDRDEATVYMTMEFLTGESLASITKNDTFTGMPLAEAYPLIEGLGRALGYAHAKRVVHSDFTPSNCFLTSNGVVKILDFGIARAAKLPDDQGSDVTHFDPGTLGALTLAYASCEMIEGEEPDARDDIYAFGCVVYELLTGRHPFDKKSAVEARDNNLLPMPVKNLNRRQWRALQKALAFSRGERCPNVEEFVHELKEHKFNKTKMAVGLAATVMLVVAAGVLVPNYQQGRQVDRLVAALSSGVDTDIAAALMEYQSLDATAQGTVLQQARDPLLDYYVGRIDSAVDAKQGRDDYPEAERLLVEAEKYFQDSAILRGLAVTLKGGKDNLLYSAELNSLLASPQLDDDWNAALKSLFNDLDRVVPESDTTVSDARSQVAGLYVNLAQETREQERYTEAERLLAEASGFQPELETLLAEQEALAAARRAVQIENTERIRIANIQDLRQTFLTAANADDLNMARRTLETLRGELPVDDPFLLTTAPEALGGAYLRLAQGRYDRSDLDGAEETARLGQAELAQMGVIESPVTAALADLIVEIPLARLAANPQEPVPETPVYNGKPCTANLAGFGSSGTRGLCFDMLDAEIEGPTLVVIPPGENLLAPFAIGKYEVSVGDWNAYCRLSGQCEERVGVSVDGLPATNILVVEARNYATWLSGLTNAVYRLPTSDEWEYAASATGVRTRTDDNCLSSIRGGSPRDVKQGLANAWGLTNFLGNAQEWVITSSGTEVRGGSYRDRLALCSVEFAKMHSGDSDAVTGFRLVRELPESALLSSHMQ